MLFILRWVIPLQTQDLGFSPNLWTSTIPRDPILTSSLGRALVLVLLLPLLLLLITPGLLLLLPGTSFLYLQQSPANEGLNIRLYRLPGLSRDIEVLKNDRDLFPWDPCGQ